MVNGTKVGTTARKKEKLKGEIVDILKHSENPVSTSDLTAQLRKAWHTIDRTCLMLQIEGKIQGFKIGNMNLWRVS